MITEDGAEATATSTLHRQDRFYTSLSHLQFDIQNNFCYFETAKVLNEPHIHTAHDKDRLELAQWLQLPSNPTLPRTSSIWFLSQP